ncbi:hypothetical protein [Kitasatospora sp. NPDC008115]|uniref:hypothetical protein n=1 Tax=Kitasatospora sp. NPDC008115 TaxID=3364022 RepID=UPI0036E475E1
MSNWFLVKYISDVFRNEPMNVGVVVSGPSGVGSRFIGEREDGSINGQRLGKKIDGVETYKAWVKFIRREAEKGRLESRIDSLARRVGDSYLIERRGPVLSGHEDQSPSEIAAELFSALVTTGTPAAPSLDALAEDAISRLDLPQGHAIDRDVDYDVADRNERHIIHFDYRHRGGPVTLMDRISLARHGKPLSQSVNDLLFRIDKMEKSGNVDNFVALYSGADASSAIEKQLRLINAYANTVNLSNSEASDTLGQILGVPTLPIAARGLQGAR